MTLLRPLTDVDVPGTQAERPCDRLLLILQGGARQMEMPQVQAGFLLLSREEPDPAISQPSTPLQKRARRSGSFASMHSASS